MYFFVFQSKSQNFPSRRLPFAQLFFRHGYLTAKIQVISSYLSPHRDLADGPPFENACYNRKALVVKIAPNASSRWHQIIWIHVYDNTQHFILFKMFHPIVQLELTIFSWMTFTRRSYRYLCVSELARWDTMPERMKPKKTLDPMSIEMITNHFSPMVTGTISPYLFKNTQYW